MTSWVRSWVALGVLSTALIGGSLAALSPVANRDGADVAKPDRATLIDAVLCAVVPDSAPAGFTAEMANAHARMHRAMADAAPSGDPDRDFARSMIPHHQGAIDMALIELRHGRDERLRRLAQTIIVEQGQEIAYMRTLLEKPLAAAGSDRVARHPGGAK